MKSYRQIVEEAKTEIPEVTVDEVKTEQEQDSDFVLLDVRDEDEYRAGLHPQRCSCHTRDARIFR